MALLEVEELSVDIVTPRGPLEVLRYSPEGVVVSVLPFKKERTRPHTFWFKPNLASNFGLSEVTMFNGSSHMLAVPP